jgi:hypothetical protein
LRGKRSEGREDDGAHLIGTSGCLIWQGINRIKEEKKSPGAVSPLVISARGRRRPGQLTGGAELPAGEGGERGTGSGFPPNGPWPKLALGLKASPRPFSYYFSFSSFSFFVFCFLFDLFITFDFDIQLISNQLLKFSKTQNILTKQ